LPPETRRGEIRVASKPPSNSEGRQSVRAVPKEVPSNLKKSPKINAAKPYSVQIIAYPEKDKAEAYAKNMRANKFSVRVEEVAIKGKGRWHRVLLGHFKSRDEALKYYNDHMIKKLYPQSFIQKQADSQ
jgi:cell division septation protein DedD